MTFERRLCDIRGCTPKRLAALDLASELLVAISTCLDVRLGDEWFAAAAHFQAPLRSFGKERMRKNQNRQVGTEFFC